ncbi:unnamed protein product, partial [Rotaria socialis]
FQLLFIIIIIIIGRTMATVQTLNYISQQLNTYWSLFMLFFGIIGCLWNILICRHHSFRYSSYCTYVFIGSVTSLIHSYCLVQNSTLYCTVHITLSCLVASAIDRFSSTCRQIKWPSLSSIDTARQI